MFEGFFKKKQPEIPAAAPAEMPNNVVQMPTQPERFPVQNRVTGEVIGTATSREEAEAMLAEDAVSRREAA